MTDARAQDIPRAASQIPFLDGMRGLAVLFVVFSHISHAGLLSIFGVALTGIGKLGVFLFFFLSSFLLSRQIVTKDRAFFTTSSVVRYFERRVFRIYPLYIVYLLVPVSTTMLVARFLDRKDGIPFELDWSGYANHLLLVEGKGVTWSVAVEFKFYFILPCLALGAIVLARRSLWLMGLGTTLAIAFSMWAFPAGQSTANEVRLGYYMPIFLVGLFAGGLDGQLHPPGPDNSPRASIVLGIIGMSILAGLVFTVPDVISLISGQDFAFSYYHKQYLAFALAFYALFLCVRYGPDWLRSFFTTRFLVQMGVISFSLYLWHPVVIQLAKFGLPDSVKPFGWIPVLLVAIVTSYFSFYLIEKPGLALGNQLRASYFEGKRRKPPIEKEPGL